MTGDARDTFHVKELYTGVYTASSIYSTAGRVGYLTLRDETGSTRKVLVYE